MSFAGIEIESLASTPPEPKLHGRRDEREALDSLLDGARHRRSGVLVLVGEPGIGKTALLDYAVQSASDFTVVRAVGAHVEMELAFAGLHQVCKPLFSALDRLPAPQRLALETTFGLHPGPAPDRFLVGLAILGLLSEGPERPVLCIVDDTQWLDPPSAQTLAFVARRLLADRVVMLFATRELDDPLVGLPSVTVEGLTDPDARGLLASMLPGRLDERIVEQLLAETKGNPLALLELPRGMTMSELAGGFGLPGAFSLEAKIQERYRQRLELLPPDARDLLLIAAAEPLGDPSLLWRAAERLGIDVEARAAAESADLLEIDRRVRFRHPIVRAAVYEAATPAARRRVHAALSEVIDPQAEPERRAWHRAAAAAGPDEEVAVELVHAAGRAQARGGLAAAAAFLERASALTAEPRLRAQRNLSAAQTKYEAGALQEALELLSATESLPLDDAQRAATQLLHAQIAFASRRDNGAPPQLLEAARGLEAIDAPLARATYLEALSAAMFAGSLARGNDLVEISEAALAGPLRPSPPDPSDLLLDALAVRFTEGLEAAAPVLKEAVRAFRLKTDLAPSEAQWLWLASRVALYLYDDEAWSALSMRHFDLVREAGAMTSMPSVLSLRISVHAWRGELAIAAALQDELSTITDATGIATVPHARLSHAAIRGRETEFKHVVETTAGDAKARGQGLTVTITDFLTATLYNGLGNYEAALSAVGDIDRFPEEGPVSWALTELIEAAARLGRPEHADDAVELIAKTTRAGGTDWALGVQARCRALLSDDNEAESLYRESIERFGRTSIRVQYARAYLVYGEWLRRQRRRLDAREQLRTAHKMFSAMGADAFAERAARELLATGEHARKRTVETLAALTPQEMQIARLAHEGLSNAEIGIRLFISRHTVEYHLRKVFMKLGINSRTKLAHALPLEPSGALR